MILDTPETTTSTRPSELLLLEEAVKWSNEGVQRLAMMQSSSAVNAIPYFKHALTFVQELMALAVNDAHSTNSNIVKGVLLEASTVAMPELVDDGFYIFNQAFTMNLSDESRAPSNAAIRQSGRDIFNILGILVLFNMSLAFHQHGLQFQDGKDKLLHASELYKMCMNLVAKQQPGTLPTDINNTATSAANRATAILLILLVCLARNNLAHITFHTQGGTEAQGVSMTFLVQAYSVLTAANPNVILGTTMRGRMEVGDDGSLHGQNELTCSVVMTEVFLNMVTVCTNMAMASAA